MRRAEIIGNQSPPTLPPGLLLWNHRQNIEENHHHHNNKVHSTRKGCCSVDFLLFPTIAMATLDTRLMYFRSRSAAAAGKKKKFLRADKWTHGECVRESSRHHRTLLFVDCLFGFSFFFFLFVLRRHFSLTVWNNYIVAQQQHFYISLLHRTAHFSFVFQLKWFSFFFWLFSFWKC